MCNFRVFREELNEKVMFMLRTLANPFFLLALCTCLTLYLELLLAHLSIPPPIFIHSFFIFQFQPKCHLLKGAFPGYPMYLGILNQMKTHYTQTRDLKSISFLFFFF